MSSDANFIEINGLGCYKNYLLLLFYERSGIHASDGNPAWFIASAFSGDERGCGVSG